MVSSTDRIRKQVILKAPLARVWRAISDADQFGAWFGIAFEGRFAAGAMMRGTIAGTKADPDVAVQMEPNNGLFELAEVAGGTQLTITETGFDALPEARRGDAFEANDEAWTTQSELIAKYLALYP